MSRKLAVVFLAMLVLVGAMGLKTAVTVRGSDSVMMANGSSPLPRPSQPYSRNGSSPIPNPPPPSN